MHLSEKPVKRQVLTGEKQPKPGRSFAAALVARTQEKPQLQSVFTDHRSEILARRGNSGLAPWLWLFPILPAIS